MFEKALIESADFPQDVRRVGGLPLALGLHAAVLGALVVSAVWSTGEPPEPQTPFVFVTLGGAPSPPPGGDHETVREHRVEKPRTRERGDMAPVSVPPETVPVETSTGEQSSSDGGGDPEAGSNSGPGVPGGTGSSAGGGAGSGGEGGSGEILHPGVNGVTVPVLLERVEPTYPRQALLVRSEGVVILQAVITGMGEVEEIRVLKSANPILDAAAVAAVQQWRYRPATRNGRAVAVYLTVTVTFGINS